MIAPALVAAALSALLPGLNPARIDELGHSIGAVAETADDAARLVVTVARESSGLLSYEICERTGDHGRAVSGYQIWKHHWDGHRRAEICADPELAAALALKVLRRRSNVAWSFTRYLGADRPSHPEVLRRVRLYAKAMAAMGGEA